MGIKRLSAGSEICFMSVKRLSAGPETCFTSIKRLSGKTAANVRKVSCPAKEKGQISQNIF
jgi:hypothetical protein